MSRTCYNDYLYSVGYNSPIPSGVYCIINVITGKLYVGSTRDFTHRATQHFKSLEEGIHHNRDLQHHFDFYGAHSFSFIILEREPDMSKLEGAEQRWLNRLSPYALNWTRKVTRAPQGKFYPVDLQPMPWEEE